MFNPEGTYLSGSSTFTSNSDYLRVFVKMLLKEVFKNPIPTYYANTKSTYLKITSSFYFEITEHNDIDLIKNNHFKSGSHLAFYRNHQYSKLQWKKGPFYGTFPEIIASLVTSDSLRLNIDYIDLYKKVKALLSKKKNSPDPLTKYKQHF